MEFFNYFKALLRSPRPKSVQVFLFVSVYVIFFVSTFAGGVAGVFTFLAAIAFASSISIGYCCNSKPNLEGAFPVNHNKKLLYRFLSSLLMFLIVVAIIIAVMIVIFIISLIFVLIFGGSPDVFNDPEFSEDVTETINTFSYIGVNGGLSALAYYILLYSGGMIAGFIKKNKHRNIYLLCLLAGIILTLIIMVLPYYAQNSDYLISPFSQTCFDAMAVPWLCTVIWFLAAFGALGVSIYMGIKHYDPKKF